MLKRLMAGPLVWRSMSSRRLMTAIAVSIMILLSGVFFLMQIWNVAAFILCLGLIVFILITVESLQSIMSGQNELRRQSRRQWRLLNSTHKGTSLVKYSESQESRPPAGGRGGSRSWVANKLADTMTSPSFNYSAVRDQLDDNKVPGTSTPISVAAAMAIWNDYTLYLPHEVLYIGAVDSVNWIYSILDDYGSITDNVTALVTPSDQRSKLDQNKPQASDQQLIFLDESCKDRPNGGSIGRLTAHMVDVIYIDLAVLVNFDSLKSALPSQFIAWLRPEARILLVNSHAVDIRPSVQKFLSHFPELLLEIMHTGNGYATLVKARA